MSRWPCVPKPSPGGDAVLVDDAQGAEAHVRGVVVVANEKVWWVSSQPWSTWPRVVGLADR